MMDVSADSFEAAVIERSRELPVIVDFWAPWCGPCHALAPVLEQEVERRGGAVELVKVNVDESPELASRYAVGGIPSVKAFSGGLVVSQFVGAIPPAAVSGFLDAIQDEAA
jgi:thioredoxin